MRTQHMSVLVHVSMHEYIHTVYACIADVYACIHISEKESENANFLPIGWKQVSGFGYYMTL